MEKIIKVNKNLCFTAQHPVLTNKGLVNAEELKKGDMIIGTNGKPFKITKIITCKENPGMPPILGETKP